MNGIEAKKKQKTYEAVIVLLNAAYQVLSDTKSQDKKEADLNYMYRINEIIEDLNNDASGLQEIYDAND